IASGIPLTSLAAGARALAVVRATQSHLTAESMVPVISTLRTSPPGGRLSRSTAMNLIWSLGTTGGNPAQRDGAFEWAEGVAERESEISQRLANEEEHEDSGASKEARVAGELLTALRAIRPAIHVLVEVTKLVADNAVLAKLWSAVRAFFSDWLIQPSDGLRV